MNPKETTEVTQFIRRMRDEGGYTILLVEYKMNLVGEISDRVIVLDYGQKIAEGAYQDVVDDEGISVFVVEQNANVALSVADRGYVLQTGEVVLSGAAEELLPTKR